MSVRCIQEHKTVLLWKGTLVPVCSFPWFHTPGTNDLNEGGCVCNPGGGRYWKHKEKHQNEDMQTARTVTVIFAGRTNEGVSFRIRGLVQQNMWASNMFGTRQTFLHHLIYLTLDLCFLQFSGMEEKGCCLSTWQSRQFSPSSRSSLHPGSFSALYSLLLGWDKVPIIWLHLCSVLLFFSLIIMFAVSLTCNMFQKFFYFSFES